MYIYIYIYRKLIYIKKFDRIERKELFTCKEKKQFKRSKNLQGIIGGHTIKQGKVFKTKRKFCDLYIDETITMLYTSTKVLDTQR